MFQIGYKIFFENKLSTYFYFFTDINIRDLRKCVTHLPNSWMLLDWMMLYLLERKSSKFVN